MAAPATRGAGRTSSSARVTWRELFGVFPVLMYAGFAQFMLNLAQARAHPALPFATVFLPVAFVMLCLYAYITTDRPNRLTMRHFALATLVLAVWLAAAFVPTWIDRLSLTGLVRVGEAGTYVVFALLAIHCLRTRGRAAALTLFGVATIYGCILESGGVSLGFFAERGYDQYLPFLAAPLVTMLDWSNVFYPCVVLVEILQQRWPTLRRTVLARALLVTVAGVALDLHIDPTATRLGFWHWNALLHPFFLGVPLINFVAWFYALLGFGVAYYLVERTAWTARRKLVAFVLAMPTALLAEGALVALTMIALEGLNGPTATIVRAYLHAHLAL